MKARFFVAMTFLLCVVGCTKENESKPESRPTEVAISKKTTEQPADLEVGLEIGMIAPEIEDTSNPRAGKFNGYLATGKNPVAEGSFGNASSGTQRPNISPCP